MTKKGLKPNVGPGPAIQNEILSSLPAKELAQFLSRAQPVRLPARETLNQIDDPIASAYFLNSGVVSIINVMSNGKSVEVGLTGKEGFIGIPVVFDYKSSSTRAIVQIAGGGYIVSVQNLRGLLATCPTLKTKLQRYSQELAFQAVQIAACNRLHGVERRLARWLMMCHDRIGELEFPLTQEFLSHMLGTRRASVTVAAGVLQKKGLITYKRGHVSIKDLPGLGRMACECYGMIGRQIQKWRKESS